jgi:hypothetical protein
MSHRHKWHTHMQYLGIAFVRRFLCRACKARRTRRGSAACPPGQDFASHSSGYFDQHSGLPTRALVPHEAKQAGVTHPSCGTHVGGGTGEGMILTNKRSAVLETLSEAAPGSTQVLSVDKLSEVAQCWSEWHGHVQREMRAITGCQEDTRPTKHNPRPASSLAAKWLQDRCQELQTITT